MPSSGGKMTYSFGRCARFIRCCGRVVCHSFGCFPNTFEISRFSRTSSKINRLTRFNLQFQKNFVVLFSIPIAYYYVVYSLLLNKYCLSADDIIYLIVWKQHYSTPIYFTSVLIFTNALNTTSKLFVKLVSENLAIITALLGLYRNCERVLELHK